MNFWKPIQFLKNGSKDYTYKNSTDWQKEIFKPAFTTENLLKVKGGDAVAKYAWWELVI